MNTATNTTSETTIASGQPSAYRYFIALQFLENGNLAVTNMEMHLRAQITSLQDVQIIERHYRDRGYYNALVIGFSLFPDAPTGGDR